jgi:hypothetical protein
MAGVLRCVEAVLPYLIVLPFGFFCYTHGFSTVKREVVQDSKQGLIKEAFVTTWLKEIAVDQVILKEVRVREKSLEFLEALVLRAPVKKEAYEIVKHLTNHQSLIGQAKNFVFKICSEMKGEPSGLDLLLEEMVDVESLSDFAS